MENAVEIHPKLKMFCEQWAQQLMSQVGGLRAVVISTADGFEVASVAHNATQTSRIAAMASSISALGEVVGQESQLGGSKSVLIEAMEGYLAVIHVPRAQQALTISIIAGSDAVAGQVLHFGRDCAKSLLAWDA